MIQNLLKTSFLTKTYWFLTFFSVLALFSANAQNATVSYNSTGSFTVCGSAQTNSLSISNGNAATMSSILATLQIPAGGTYVAGSITGATESNISNLNAPVFSVPNISASNSGTITYQLSFGCGVIAFQGGGGLTKETVNFTYNLGASAITDNNKTTPSTYNVVAAALSITNATNTSVSRNVGDTYSQSLTIVNGGLGCTSNAFVKLDRAGGTFSFSNPSIGTISNDTLFLAAANMPGGDNLWCNGESLIVSYDVSINNCTTLNRAARAGWGCGGSTCQVSTAQNSNVIINNVTPLLESSVTSSNLNYCFAGENQKQTVRITNTGAGPATNIRVRQHAFFPGQFLALARFDTTANWELRNSSGTVIGSLSRFTILEAGPNDFRGAGCGLITRFREIEVPINVILAPGDYIEYDVWMTAQNLECYQCNNSTVGLGFRTNVLYSNQCGTQPYATGYKETVKRGIFGPSQVLTGPVDVAGGVPFNLSLLINHTSATTDHLGRGSVFIAIPTAGLDLSTTATSITSLGRTLAVETRSDTIFIGPFPDNVSFTRDFNLPLTFACGTGGPKTVESFFLTQYNETCSPVQKRGCTSYTINVLCPQPCLSGGATPMNFALRRINFGLVDNDNNGIPDASGVLNMSLVKDHNSVNGDTLRGTWNIKVFPNTVASDPNVGQAFNHLYIDFKLGGTSPAAAGTLTALPNATATIFPAGGGASTTCMVSPTVTGQIAHYDFSACKSSWVGGDSLVVNALYTVNQNNNENYGGATVSGLTLFVTDNEVYTTYVPQATPTTAPINGSTYTCQSFNDYNQMARLRLRNDGNDNVTITGCNNLLEASAGVQVGALNGGDVNFPYEYRNFFIPDTLRYTIPTGFSYRPTTAKLGTTVINDANVSQVGNVIYFTNLKSLYLPYGGSLLPGDEEWDAEITFSIDPSCDAVAGVSSGSSKFVGVGNGLNTPLTNYGTGNTVNDNTGQNNVTFTNNPAIPVLAGGGTVVTNTGAASWNIQLQNQANNADAANSFFYIQPTNSLSNIVIREQPNNNEITPDVNGYYRLGTLLRSANRNFTVTADLSRCALDSMRINFGNACLGYPTTPFTVQSCTQLAWLKASGFPASLDVTFDKVPSTGTVGLCTPVTFEALINSTLVGNLDNEVLKVVLPTGMSYVPGSVQVLYPTSGTFTANAYNPTMVADTAIFTVNSLTGGVGLTGVGNLPTAQVRIRFNLSTACGYTSGKSVKAIVTGASVCGDPVPTVVKTSSAISITGAIATTQYAITVTSPTSFITCNTTPSTVTVKVVNTGTINAATNDSLTIDLSNGLSYIAGSFASIKNAPSVTAPVQSGNLLRWQIPSAVAPGDSMKFTINLQGNSAGCGQNTLDLYTTQSIELACGALSCNTPVITGRLISETITTICCVNVSGNVFNDPNVGNVNNSSGAANLVPSGLFANLIGSNGNVVAKIPIATDGTYSFANVVPGTYTVVSGTTEGTVGQPAPAQAWPTGWLNTGDFNGDPNTGNTNTTPNVSDAFTVSTDVTNINFGIQQPPTATTNTDASVPNPGGTASEPVTSALFTGADPTTGGTVNFIKITAFPTGATSITVSGTTYTSANFPSAGITIPAVDGVISAPISVDPSFADDGNVVIPYVTIDNAGVSSAEATVTQPFTKVTLPVSLLRFDGKQIEDVINLTWKTADEKNFSHFEIEKSVNSIEFGAIGKVIGSKVSIYNFKDSNPNNNENYYRLKMVDLDGTIVRSKIISVNYEKGGLFVNVENPALNGVININTSIRNPIFSLRTLSGSKIDFKATEIGTNKYKLEAKSLVQGVYMLSINYDGRVITKKILVQE